MVSTQELEAVLGALTALSAARDEIERYHKEIGPRTGYACHFCGKPVYGTMPADFNPADPKQIPCHTECAKDRALGEKDKEILALRGQLKKQEA